MRLAVAAAALTLVATAQAGRLIIPFAMSSPEYGVGFGVKARARGLFGGPGFGDLTGMVTTRGQWFVEFYGLRDSIDGRWRLGGKVEGGIFPELYGGEGSPAAQSALARYTPRYGLGSLYAGCWFPGGIRLDLGFKLDARDITHADTGVYAGWSAGDRHWSDGGTQVRPTVDAEWRALDHDDDPRSGLALEGHFEPPFPGSPWTTGYVQATGVATPSVSGPTLALRLRHEEAAGRVPFWELPSAGKSKVLRGLSDYRVRGRSLQVAGLEARQPFALFGHAWQVVGFGEVARAGDESTVWEADPVFGYGCGGRLLLDDRHAVLRVDLGWNSSREAGPFPSIYVDFGQAF